MLVNILAALAVSALLALVIWLLRGHMLTPVRAGEDLRLTVVVEVSGSGEGLEAAVRAIAWLRENGTLPCEIEIRGSGLSEAARETAEAPRARREGGVYRGRDLVDKRKNCRSSTARL